MAAPYSSCEDVLAALNSLIYTIREPDVSALTRLLLVDLLVTDPTMPAADEDEARGFALRDLLTSEISSALAEQWRQFALAPIDLHARLDQVQAAIVRERAVMRATAGVEQPLLPLRLC